MKAKDPITKEVTWFYEFLGSRLYYRGIIRKDLGSQYEIEVTSGVMTGKTTHVVKENVE